MGIEEYKIGSLFLAVLYGLPGYLVIHVVSKFCFVKSRSFSGFTFQLLSAVVLSTALLYFYNPVINFTDDIFKSEFLSKYITLSIGTQRLTPDFKEKLFTTIFENPQGSSSSEVISFLLIKMNCFAVIVGALLAFLINSIKGLAFREAKSIPKFLIYLEFFMRKPYDLIKPLCIRSTFIQATNRIFNTPLPSNHITKFLSPIYKFFVFLFVLMSVIFVIALFFTFYILHLSLELLSIFIYYSLRLFQHPAEGLFESLKFKNRKSIPIVEILGSNNILSKGKYLTFQPKNSEDISSITITNVMQYSKRKGQIFFLRGQRDLYEFPDFDSKMTISTDTIIDFNVRYLHLNDDSWELSIVDLESIKNQLWYLRVFLMEKKYTFAFRNFNAYIDWQYSMEFFSELLELLEKIYPSIIERYHLSRLFDDFMKYLHTYRIRCRQGLSSLSQSEQERVKSARQTLAKQIKVMRKKLKNY